jgi:hypothetical protein
MVLFSMPDIAMDQEPESGGRGSSRTSPRQPPRVLHVSFLSGVHDRAGTLATALLTDRQVSS